MGGNCRTVDRCLTLALGDWVKRMWALKPQNTHFKSQVYSTQSYNPSPWGGGGRRLSGLMGSQTNLSVCFRMIIDDHSIHVHTLTHIVYTETDRQTDTKIHRDRETMCIKIDIHRYFLQHYS